MKKKCKFLLPFLCFVLILSSCAFHEEPVETAIVGKEAVFHAGEFSITLTDSFSQLVLDGYAFCAFKQGVDVYALKEEFSLAEGLKDMSLSEYGQSMIEGNQLDASVVKVESDEGLTWYEYEVTVEESNFSFLTYLYKTSDAFWVVQFALPQEKRDANLETVRGFAKSVSFTPSEN